jgi:hypothetical protein
VVATCGSHLRKPMCLRHGGEGWIRTLGTGISQYNGLAKMDRSRRPHSFSSTYSRMRGRRVGLSASHSAVIVLRRALD